MPIHNNLAPPHAQDRAHRIVSTFLAAIADALHRRELPRLLAEGHANRWTLIRQGAVLGVWDTYRDALQAGYERFSQPGVG